MSLSDDAAMVSHHRRLVCRERLRSDLATKSSGASPAIMINPIAAWCEVAPERCASRARAHSE
jgi:hypothetical protein